MPKLCYGTLKRLSDRPQYEAFKRSLKCVLQHRGADIAFVVRFGSMATGQWLPSSGYDLLIGLNRDDHRRLVDRLGEFQSFQSTEMDFFPYSLSERQSMFADRHLPMMDALDKGLALADDGSFAQMRRQFHQWPEKGGLCRTAHGWEVSRAQK